MQMSKEKTLSDESPANGGGMIPDSVRRQPAEQAGSWHPSQFRAVVLLGGTVRNSGFGATIKRSLLDLPIGGRTTLLEHWGNEISELAGHLGMAKINVRLVIGR